jgi:hypothetical protein
MMAKIGEQGVKQPSFKLVPLVAKITQKKFKF